MPGRIWIVSLLVLGFSFCSLQKPPRTLPAKAQPLETPAAEIYQTGEASWYGEDFHGKTTANGEVYDMNKLTAAHQRLPFDTLVDVENVENGRTVRVRINDRGPFLKNRIIDLSFKAAQRLGMADQGTARVCLRVVRMGQGPAIPAVEGGGGVWLQAGAFGEYGNARELAERVQALLPEARVLILEESRLFKVVVGAFSSEAKAAEVQSSLTAKGIQTFIRHEKP